MNKIKIKKINKDNLSSIMYESVSIIILFLGLIIMLGPFLWMILSSFKVQTEIMALTPTLFPKKPTLMHYEKIFAKIPIFKYYLNSIIVAVISTMSSVITSVSIGYVLAKFQFKLKSFVFSVVMATMMLPFSVTMIPLFLEISMLNLTDALAGLILPFLCSGTGIFLMRQSLFSFPSELREAAIIDGCGEFTVLARIVFPLNSAMISSLTILMFMVTWDGYLWPLLTIQSEEMYTLPLGLAMLNVENLTDYGVLMAGATISVVPIIIVFLFMQKNFIEALTISGIKG